MSYADRYHLHSRRFESRFLEFANCTDVGKEGPPADHSCDEKKQEERRDNRAPNGEKFWHRGVKPSFTALR